MTDDTEKKEYGLVCKDCGCRHFFVNHTKRQNRRIIRYRSCRNCGRRVTTVERIIERGE